MMRKTLWAAVLAAAVGLGGCGDRGAKEEAASQVQSGPPVPGQPLQINRAGVGCAAATDGAWEPAAGEIWTLSASTEGAACAEAIARLVVTDPKGVEAMRLEIPVSASPVLFAEATTPETIAAALQGWAEPDAMLAATGRLPDWPLGAPEPMSGEFPFVPEEGVDRSRYLELRSLNLPMLCLIQGGESMACAARDPSTGKLIRVGVQTFPG